MSASLNQVATLETTASTNSPRQDAEFKLYPRRFAVATGVFFTIFSNNVLFGAYGSITPSVAQHYNTDTYTINCLNLANCAAFLVAVVPSTWMLDTVGLRDGTRMSAALTVVGALLHQFAYLSPSTAVRLSLLYIGSIIIGLGTPLCIDASTKAAAHWFAGDGRLLANAVMGLATPIGGAVGLLSGPLLVNGDPNNVETVNRVMFAVAAVCGLATFLVHDKPPSPPSKSAEKGTIPFREGVQLILTNIPFWILTFVFGCTFATFQILSTFISNYVTPYGYSEDDAGNLGVAVVGSGIVAAVVVGYILDRIKAHRSALKLLAVLFVAGAVMFYFGCTSTAQSLKWMLFVGAVLIGIGGLPILSVSMELGAECTYPVPEATSTGILMTASNVLVVILFILNNPLTDADQKMWRAMAMLVGIVAAGTVASFLYTGANRRMELETLSVVEEEVEVVTGKASTDNA